MKHKEYIYSLIFPVVAVITGMLWACNGFPIPALIMVPSGIVSAFITIAWQTDTSKYIKIRILFFVISLITFSIPLILFNALQSTAILNILLVWLIAAPFIAFVAELIIFVKRQLFKEPKALTAILLSEPLTCNLIVLIYALVIWCIYGV